MSGVSFLVEQGNDDAFHWHLVDEDGTVLAVSSLGFASEQDARAAADDVRRRIGALPPDG